MNTRRPHWSYSAINQFLRCPLQYYFERVLKLPRETISGNMLLGRAVHAGLALYHLQLFQGEKTEPEKVRMEFLAAMEQDQALIEFSKDATFDGMVTQGIKLIDLWMAEPPPTNIVGVELELFAPLENSAGEVLETPLFAIIDLVRQENDKLVIHEFKTTARAFSPLEIHSALQATCYTHALQETLGTPAVLEYTALVKTKEPKLQRISTHRTDADFKRLGDIVETIERAIEAEAFYPNQTAMNCSGCSYRDECASWCGRSQELPVVETIQLPRKCVCSPS